MIWDYKELEPKLDPKMKKADRSPVDSPVSVDGLTSLGMGMFYW